MSFQFNSFHFMSFHIASFPFISFHFISFHFISFHFISCFLFHAILISCHVLAFCLPSISFYFTLKSRAYIAFHSIVFLSFAVVWFHFVSFDVLPGFIFLSCHSFEFISSYTVSFHVISFHIPVPLILFRFIPFPASPFLLFRFIAVLCRSCHSSASRFISSHFASLPHFILFHIMSIALCPLDLEQSCFVLLELAPGSQATPWFYTWLWNRLGILPT